MLHQFVYENVMVETAKGLTNVEIDEQHPLLFCQGYEVIQA